MAKACPKKCIVPGCKNNSANSPAKLFLALPKDPNRQKLWAQALNLDYLPVGGQLRCCEDHFNLEEDCTNWMYVKIMGARIILKSDVVPSLVSRFSKTKINVDESQTSQAAQLLFKPSMSSVKTVCFSEALSENKQTPKRMKSSQDKFSQTTQQFRNVALQANIKQKYRSVQIEAKPEVKDQFTSTTIFGLGVS